MHSVASLQNLTRYTLGYYIILRLQSMSLNTMLCIQVLPSCTQQTWVDHIDKT